MMPTSDSFGREHVSIPSNGRVATGRESVSFLGTVERSFSSSHFFHMGKDSQSFIRTALCRAQSIDSAGSSFFADDA